MRTRTFGDFVSLVKEYGGSADVLGDFLEGITSSSERHELARRLEIVERLILGQTNNQITSDMHIGVGTVSRGQRALNEGRFLDLRAKKNKPF